MTDPARDIIERVNRLEREFRRRGIAVTVACIVLAGAFLLGQVAPQKEALTGDSFVLRGPGGDTSATLASAPDGTPHLQFFNVFSRQKQTPVAELGVDRSGSPSLVFWDEDRHLRAELRLAGDGSPSLTLRDKNALRSI